MIVLPDGEEILDVVCGDKDFWVISATHNIAHVKPAKEGAATNLNLVTASGAVYSFLLTEKNGTATPDLKVYVTADPERCQSRSRSTSAPPRWRVCRRELTEARAAVEAAERRATRRWPPTSSSTRPRCSSHTASPKLREAVLRPRDLARRAVHLHQDGRARSCRRSTR